MSSKLVLKRQKNHSVSNKQTLHSLQLSWMFKYWCSELSLRAQVFLWAHDAQIHFLLEAEIKCVQTRPFFGGLCRFLASNSSIFHVYMWCAVEPQKVTGRVSPTSLHSFHYNQGAMWKRIDQTFGTWPFFTPLKLRITSGCQRVMLSKSCTT